MTVIQLIGGALYQWDTDRQVALYPKANNTVNEVHFMNPNGATAYVVEPTTKDDVVVANIPNVILQTAVNIRVYAVMTTENGERTVSDCTFGVNPKQKPSDYVYTETEVRTYDALDKRIKQLEQNSGGKPEETDPTVPEWAKQPEPPKYSAKDVGALSSTDVDQTYNPKSENAQSGVAVAEAIKGNPNCHADFFNISDDGEISIKTESAENIPADLIIPEVVNEIAVDRLSSKMFYGNTRIESVTFPDTIEEIPDECFNTAVNLKRLNNTEHIKKIGARAFRWTRIEKAVFPNLEEIIGTLAFSTIPHLAYADVGKVTEIPAQTFKHCNHLSKVVGTNVTTVGKEAFNNTVRLVNVDFINQLTSIGDYGFWLTNFDKWDDLKSTAALGTNATTLKANPTDFWSNVEFTPCENPTPTAFCQRDDRWVNRHYGGVIPGTNKEVTYADGCLQMCAMHLYSGFYNMPFTSVTEFEKIVKGIESVNVDGISYTGTELLEMQDTTPEKNVIMLRGLDLTCVVNTEWNADNLTALYTTLKNGGYAIVIVNVSGNHAVIVYGVTEKGELLVLDSERRYPYDSSKSAQYKLPIQKLLLNTSDYILVTK